MIPQTHNLPDLGKNKHGGKRKGSGAKKGNQNARKYPIGKYIRKRLKAA